MGVGAIVAGAGIASGLAVGATTAVGAGLIGAGVAAGASIYSSDQASKAANAQTAAIQSGINAQTAAQSDIKTLLSPYRLAGEQSLISQMNLLGLNGGIAQASAINNIKNSSQFTELAKSGENAILQNASATGGLRGGNTQAALGKYAPALLQSLISDRYANLGGITSLGQNAAAQTGNQGMQAANSVSNLLTQQGNATASGLISQANIVNSGINTGMNLLGNSYNNWGGLNNSNTGTSNVVNNASSSQWY